MSVDMKTLTIDSQTFEIVDAEARQKVNELQAAVGSPLVASTASSMTDHNKVYVYTGSESGYTSGHWYYWNGSAWTDGGAYNSLAISTDKTLSVENVAADAKKTGDEIADLKSAISGGVGIPSDVKEALLDCIAHIGAWSDGNGQAYYDALEAALYPPAELVSISAVYTQTGNVYPDDSLDSLKDDLVVTAHYDDQSTSTVTTYTLSGTLAEGTSTVTVSYSGKTTAFTVTVSAQPQTKTISYPDDFTATNGHNTSAAYSDDSGNTPIDGTITGNTLLLCQTNAMQGRATMSVELVLKNITYRKCYVCSYDTTNNIAYNCIAVSGNSTPKGTYNFELDVLNGQHLSFINWSDVNPFESITATWME